uniref:SFRICE_014744 n=1 Tax=Spodoptera frugiperda TaxID=7108 RepID=A0A2H1VR21_SPOFR
MDRSYANAGNATVTPLMLRVFMGGADRLSSGGPSARLPPIPYLRGLAIISSFDSYRYRARFLYEKMRAMDACHGYVLWMTSRSLSPIQNRDAHLPSTALENSGLQELQRSVTLVHVVGRVTTEYICDFGLSINETKRSFFQSQESAGNAVLRKVFLMKQIQRGDVITGYFLFNIMRDILRGARDITNHTLSIFQHAAILQSRCQFIDVYDDSLPLATNPLTARTAKRRCGQRWSTLT